MRKQDLSKPVALAIVGPTASGKTPLSYHLAEHLRAEIISADSRQVYRLLDIGTAKPSPEELKSLPHHFIDILDPDQDYNAAQYAAEARTSIQKILRAGKVPIIVGGSGLYIKGIVEGFFDGPGKDPALRTRLEEELLSNGIQHLMKRLKEVDPETHTSMEAGKPRRVIRALEVFEQTGKPLSYWKRIQSSAAEFSVVQIGLRWERQALYRTINERAIGMIKRGLVDEAASIVKKGFSRSLNSLNTVGYKEAFDFLDGAISQQRMAELILQNTRRYAKRQMTWFGADPNVRWIDVHASSNFESFAKKILNEHPHLAQN